MVEASAIEFPGRIIFYQVFVRGLGHSACRWSAATNVRQGSVEKDGMKTNKKQQKSRLRRSLI
jgi:hypothetical protein